jgi:16S rRNA (guanine966-N2)-methyltransferase
MRVIAGTARGIELKRPRSTGTRPTAGRLRESLFAMLESAGADFSRVLDLYAGSGALGIEALSRGQGTAVFVESERRVAALIGDNLERTRLAEQGMVVVARVARWRPSAGETFTLVLADPPYDLDEAWGEIEHAVTGALAPHATIAVEHAARREPPAELAGLPLWRDRRQGAGAAAIYRPEEADTLRTEVLRARRAIIQQGTEEHLPEPEATP